ncbi:MAG: acyltransferase, partial [Salinibacterium sp.]
MKRTEARGREIRHEIQALRMIAVLAVVLFHFWPARVPGGFVGVDVFFVISGYLITSHLLSELRDSGRISFAAFYARRARRILPAATVVLLACLAGVIAISSMVDWQGFVGQILASTAFVENWWLAAASVDYLGATALPSPVQHYWSLSVEEQFYVLWPALLAGVYWATSRYLPGSSRRVLGIVLGLVATASLAFSILTTMSNPNSAFFNTAARFWELAAGGLLAYFGVSVSRVPAIRLVASLLGWALIAASLILFTAVTPFPGYAAALPVAGTVLVIWAGVPSEFRFWQVLNDNALVRHLAGTSFAAYLW